MRCAWLPVWVLLLLAAPAGAGELAPYRGGATPPLQLSTLDGRRVDLTQYRGRVVLVNFWASWCPPCVHEMPSMQRLHDKLGGRGVAILAVNLGEEPARVREFVGRLRLQFPILLDPDGAALKAWKVFAFPTSFVLGPDGRIRYALYGALDWDTPDVINTLTQLMPPSPAPQPVDRPPPGL